jgi:hypothetical protein
MTFSSPKDNSNITQYIFLMSLALLLNNTLAIATPFKACENFTNSYLDISSISFDHDPTEGEDLKITLDGTASKETHIAQLELQIF